MTRYLRPSALIVLAANLVPLIGVLAWGWDAFVLLMLYWLETAVIAFWTAARLAFLPPSAMTYFDIDPGRPPPSPPALAMVVTLTAALFMAVHLFILWELFAGTWSQRVHGVRDFVQELVIGTGLWVPLLALFIARGALMLLDGAEPWLRQTFGLRPGKHARQSGREAGEMLVLGLYARIIVMQVTIIIGGWLALLAGTAGALVVLIALKAAVDLSSQAIANRFNAAWLKAKAAAKPQA
jgi:hypothetical protein